MSHRRIGGLETSRHTGTGDGSLLCTEGTRHFDEWNPTDMFVGIHPCDESFLVATSQTCLGKVGGTGVGRLIRSGGRTSIMRTCGRLVRNFVGNEGYSCTRISDVDVPTGIRVNSDREDEILFLPKQYVSSGD